MEVCRSNAPSGLKRSWKFLAVTLLWAGAMIAGGIGLAEYANTAGESAGAGSIWPGASRLPVEKGKAALLLFAHPLCPCTAASLGELERLMPFARDRVAVNVVFTRPPKRSPAWVQGSLWQKAKDIPGVHVVMDEGYREIELFGAKTSGQVLLYDEGGTLIFNGGITPSRGHMGDSYGREYVLSWIKGESLSKHTAKVFGCALKEAEIPL